MADNPITTPLPADLPTDWIYGQTIGPQGTDVGLTQQHGYNYLMQQVNAAQQAATQIGEAFASIPNADDVDPAGSAAAVQANLTAHIGNKSNPHGVTAAQAGARPNTWVPAWGDVTGKPSTFPPSGHTHDASQIVSGILPAARGGTGVGSIAALASLLAGQGLTKIQTLTYTGTGTHGVNNPNTLTFNFQPKLVIIFNGGGTNDDEWDWDETASLTILSSSKSDGLTMADSGFSNVGVRMGWLKVTWTGNSVSWYINRVNASGTEDYSRFQSNVSQITYAVIAFG